jgi:large subunit ribosomal protein L4
MPTVDVYNLNKEKVGELSLSDVVFGAEVKEHLFYEVVRMQLATRRAGTVHTKLWADISGGGKKPWKQKHTGRARVGSARSPLWRHGVTIHGPQERDYSYKVPKKVRKAALRGAVSLRVKDQDLVVLDNFELAEIKTKGVAEVLKRFDLPKVLIVEDGDNEKLVLSARNLPNVLVLPVEGLNVYDVLRFPKLVLTKKAAEAVAERLA